MTIFLKHIALKCLIVVISLQIINLGIDAIDFQPLTSGSTIGNFNYINSMTEYVTEIVLGVTDAFPEYQKESSSSKSQILKHFSIKFCEHQFDNYRNNMNEIISLYLTPRNETSNCLFSKEVTAPPPKV